MQEQMIAGTRVLTKTGRIESTGNGQTTPLFDLINGITFDDGETIRRFVQVERSIASWLSPGVEGTFVFTKGPGKVLMLTAVETQNGLRVANPKFATHVTAEASGHIIWYGLAAVICVSLVGLIGPLAIITTPPFLIFLTLAIKGMWRVGPYSGFGAVVRTLDRTRKLPTTPEVLDAPAMVAA
ncbi:MAG: hypothetical protein JWR51_3853 [Devosia sp.]|nr:hypothetical protein [Devosia sp.]